VIDSGLRGYSIGFTAIYISIGTMSISMVAQKEYSPTISLDPFVISRNVNQATDVARIILGYTRGT